MKKIIVITLVIGLATALFFSWQHFEKMKATTSQVAFFDKPDSKIWLHRVYDFKVANKLLPKFKGLETDIVFDTSRNVFDLRHDVDDDFHNRTLDNFFNGINDANKYYYWLDFKNLGKNTLSGSISRLEFLINKYDLKDRLIVESYNLKDLSKIKEHGIAISYWGPHFEITDKKEWDNSFDNLKNALYKYDIDAISFHCEMTPFLSSKFNDCNVHVWTNGLYLESDRKTIDSLANLDFIKVILVDLESSYSSAQ